MENANNAFTLTPMNQKIPLNPGEIYRGSITVTNPSYAIEDFHYQAYATPYGVMGDDYTADLTTKSKFTAIADWIEIEEPTGVIKPSESKEIKFTITVPKDAEAGGQYATITVSSNSNLSDTEGVVIQDIYEMASIIYADIAGDINHDGKVLENNIPGFVLSTPVTVDSLLTNDGNVHETAYITITAADFFTGRVIIPTEETPGTYSEVIMPGTTHRIVREINSLPEVGIVKITQQINYNSQTSTEEKTLAVLFGFFK